MESMYKDKTLTGLSQEGETVRQKAAKYDAFQQEVMRKAQEQEMDRRLEQAAANFANRGANDYNPTLRQAINDGVSWMGDKLGGLADSFVNVVTGETSEQAQRYNPEAQKLLEDVRREAARKVMMEQQGR